MRAVTMIALLIAPIAHAQTAQQVINALDSIRAQDKVLQAAYDNLKGMAVGSEAEAVNSIIDNMNMFRTTDGMALAVGDLLPKMRDPEDAKAVRTQLQFSLITVLKQMDIAVKYTNGFMALIKGPAAVAEATKARDAMNAIRDQLHSLASDRGTTASKP